MTPACWCCPVYFQIFNSWKGKHIYQKSYDRSVWSSEIPRSYLVFMCSAAPARSTILATRGTLTQLPQEQGQPASSVFCCHRGYPSPAAWLCTQVDQRQPRNLNVAECREWRYLSSATRLLRVCNNMCVLVTHLHGEQRFWLQASWEEQWRGFFSLFLC